MSYKHFYTKFLMANSNRLHFAAHSHHYWPDVTLEASVEYWQDSCKLVDDKWGKIFSEKIPQTQKLIAEILNLNNPEQIVFAPNTHELVFRVISSFLNKNKPIQMLSTDSEFYSFERQSARLEEDSWLAVDRIPAEPFADFGQRFAQAAQHKEYDVIFLSQVFFNSGIAVPNLSQLVQQLPPNCVIIVDGYHGFMALPTDLSTLQDRIFYIAGSYKYAQGGEGCCFMTVPRHCELRPLYTGWFANLNSLGNFTNKVAYDNSGMRFAGSTMDYTALYRLQATLSLFKQHELSVENIHAHVKHLQLLFLSGLSSPVLSKQCLLENFPQDHGHFLAFKMTSPELANKLYQTLRTQNIVCDTRKDIIRFGFAIYHDQKDVEKLVTTLNQVT